jgi:hypothetical protein
MKGLLKLITATITLTIVLHLYLHLMFSHKAAYDRISLGTSRGEVERVLSYQQLGCMTYSGVAAHSNQCIFRDPWREYRIILDEQNAFVTSKRVTSLRPRPPLVRLIHGALGVR